MAQPRHRRRGPRPHHDGEIGRLLLTARAGRASVGPAREERGDYKPRPDHETTTYRYNETDTDGVNSHVLELAVGINTCFGDYSSSVVPARTAIMMLVSHRGADGPAYAGDLPAGSADRRDCQLRSESAGPGILRIRAHLLRSRFV